MTTCPSCQQPTVWRHGHNRQGRHRYSCQSCGVTFTEASTSAFAVYRWPADIILTAVSWYLSYPLSTRQVSEILAEGGIDSPPERS